MAARLDILLEQWLLRHEIGLGVKEMATAATGLSLRMLGASALDREAALGPKAALANDVFHTLEPPRIIGVVIWKIKRLGLPCRRVDAIAHAWAVRLVSPKTLGILGDINTT
jgi:hypothetical protein